MRSALPPPEAFIRQLLSSRGPGRLPIPVSQNPPPPPTPSHGFPEGGLAPIQNRRRGLNQKKVPPPQILPDSDRNTLEQDALDAPEEDRTLGIKRREGRGVTGNRMDSQYPSEHTDTEGQRVFVKKQVFVNPLANAPKKQPYSGLAHYVTGSPGKAVSIPISFGPQNRA